MRFLVVVLAATLAIAGACSSDDDGDDAASSSSSTAADGGPNGSTPTGGDEEEVDVTGDTTVEATVGEVVTLSLEANETTGYRWSESVEGSAVRSQGGEYEAPEGGAIGAGGTQRYRFEAVEPGTTTVTLTYTQVGSGEVGQTYVVTFEVS